MTKPSIEERKAKARAKLDRLREVTQTGGRFADRMDWRPKAKIYLHPDTELHDRRRVWFPKVIEPKDDDQSTNRRTKKKMKQKISWVPYVVHDDKSQCPFADLRRILEDKQDIDGDEVILSIGEGRDKVELCKGEILGWDGYDYRKRLTPQADFVCVALMIEDSKGKQPKELKLEVLAAAKSLGEDIRKEIESEIDEGGEDEGNPFLNPFPFIITYDADAQPSQMYDARARIQEKPSDDVLRLLECDPPDIKSEIEPDDVDVVLAVINTALVYDGIEIHVEGEVFKSPDSSEETSHQTSQSKMETEIDESIPESETKARSDSDQKEEPTKKEQKPRTKKVTKEKTLGWVPTDEQLERKEYDICPTCDEKIPQDAEECPHPGCDAKYVIDEPF